jgi:hypothetical protein
VNADPDPALKMNADPDPALKMNADPDKTIKKIIFFKDKLNITCKF